MLELPALVWESGFFRPSLGGGAIVSPFSLSYSSFKRVRVSQR